MQQVQENVFTRDDTFFGVCEAIGQDFGFNPNWLRAGFGAALIWSPVASIAVYVAVGALIAVSRLLVREPRAARTVAIAPAAAAPAMAGDNDAEALAVAA